MKTLVEFRIDLELLAALDKIAAEEHIGRSSVIRRLLALGVKAAEKEKQDGR